MAVRICARDMDHHTPVCSQKRGKISSKTTWRMVIMNNIKAAAEEVTLTELVYTDAYAAPFPPEKNRRRPPSTGRQ